MQSENQLLQRARGRIDVAIQEASQPLQQPNPTGDPPVDEVLARRAGAEQQDHLEAARTVARMAAEDLFTFAGVPLPSTTPSTPPAP